MSAIPDNLPDPIIYGPDQPQLLLMTLGGKQRAHSRTNQNLQLTSDDFVDGTYPMGRFLATREECQLLHQQDPARPRGCPMIAEAHWLEAEFTESGEDEEVDGYWAKPYYDRCPGVGTLLNFCQSIPQRRFLMGYCRSADTLGSPSAEDRARLEAERGVSVAEMGPLHCLTYPALIPEVWINVLPPLDRTEAEEAHLQKNPQRVDFLMLAEGRKCIIEIDGPSHYANYNEVTGDYTVSEERYTFNLRVERSMRAEGFEIYRFSNHEVRNTPEEEFGNRLAHLPGYRPRQD